MEIFEDRRFQYSFNYISGEPPNSYELKPQRLTRVLSVHKNFSKATLAVKGQGDRTHIFRFSPMVVKCTSAISLFTGHACFQNKANIPSTVTQ